MQPSEVKLSGTSALEIIAILYQRRVAFSISVTQNLPDQDGTSYRHTDIELQRRLGGTVEELIGAPPEYSDISQGKQKAVYYSSYISRNETGKIDSRLRTKEITSVIYSPHP